jgi:hypothetical protein
MSWAVPFQADIEAETEDGETPLWKAGVYVIKLFSSLQKARVFSSVDFYVLPNLCEWSKFLPKGF